MFTAGFYSNAKQLSPRIDLEPSGGLVVLMARESVGAAASRADLEGLLRGLLRKVRVPFSLWLVAWVWTVDNTALGQDLVRPKPALPSLLWLEHVQCGLDIRNTPSITQSPKANGRRPTSPHRLSRTIQAERTLATQVSGTPWGRSVPRTSMLASAKAWG
jgi:hypothetical protein